MNKNRYNWVPGSSLRIETNNFSMKSLTLEDANNRHVDWLNDSEVNKWLNSNWKDHTIKSVKNFILMQDQQKLFHLGIFVKTSNLHIGNFTILIDNYHKTSETRVLLGDKSWWGKGVVIECRSMILNWLFDEKDMYIVYGYPAIKNIAAVFNYQKQGYECEAILKKNKVAKDRKRYDVGIFSITKDKWKKLNTE